MEEDYWIECTAYTPSWRGKKRHDREQYGSLPLDNVWNTIWIWEWVVYVLKRFPNSNRDPKLNRHEIVEKEFIVIVISWSGTLRCICIQREFFRTSTTCWCPSLKENLEAKMLLKKCMKRYRRMEVSQSCRLTHKVDMTWYSNPEYDHRS